MSEDVEKDPLMREFYLKRDGWRVLGRGSSWYYSYDKYPELDHMVVLLENKRLVAEVTDSNVKRYRLSEELVAYLRVRGRQP